MTYTDDQSKALDELAKWVKSDNTEHTLDGAAGTGKAQPNTTCILTTVGYIPIGQVKVGDSTFTEKGEITKINGVFPQGKREIYEVFFNDNTSVKCDLEHIWSVSPKEKRGKMSYRNMTTKELINTDLIKQTQRDIDTNRKGSLQWQIPVCGAIQHTEKEFLINPYVLGVLIGDGSLVGSCVTIYNPLEDVEIIHKVKTILKETKYEVNRSNKTEESCASYSIVKGKNKNAFINIIKSINLNITSLDKFIPDTYFLGSVEQRVELLKGLMDTDGTINKQGNRARYSTSSLQLAKDVINLVQSLGGKATMNKQIREGNNPEYTVNLLTPMNCFYLMRKRVLWRESKITRYISKIEKTGNTEDSTCISVDSEAKLYITENYIVTHNTTIAKQFIQNLNYHSSKIAVTAPTHQAKNVIERATDFPSQTIQKLLGLRPHIELDDFNPNRPVFAAKASDTMRYYKIVIIDEASMINAKAKKLITKKAKEYGTKILYMGDAYQLPPVGEYLSHVFSDVSGVSTLNEVVRQKLENPMTSVLIALREDIKYNKTDGITRLLNSSEHMVGDMGFRVLSNNKEGFGDALLQYYLSTEYQHNKDHIKLLTYTNNSVETWSEGIRKNILREDSLNLINIGESLIGYNTISNRKTGNIVIQNSASYEVTNVVSATNNYDIEGYYTTLKDENGREFAVFIVDHRKKERFTTLLKEVLDKAVINGGRYWQDYYKFKDQHLVLDSLYKDDTKPKDFNNLLCKKDLYYGYAMTVHKSQGSTYDNIAVNVKSIQTNWKAHEVSRLLYVALSRARNTNLILKP